MLFRSPDAYIFEPWTMPPALQEHVGCIIGRDYAAPIVDHLGSAKFARDTLWALRKNDSVRDAAKQVYKKHGSRNPAREGVRGRVRDGKPKTETPAAGAQLSFGFE